MNARYDALVIGGGVAGATAAILLAQAGWSVALVEKRAFPRRKVCGECIAATNLALLDALGIGDELAGCAGPPLERVGFCLGDETLVAELPRLRGAPSPWGRALGRDRLDALLLARAAALGVAVWQPWSAVDLARRDGWHTCPVVAGADAEPGREAVLGARVVVDAHGSWEPALAAAQRSRTEPRAADLLAFKANFGDARLEPGVLPVLAFDGGYGGMVIADEQRLTLACCIRRDRLRAARAAAPGVAAGEAVEALLTRSCAGVAAALDGARRVGAWLAVGPIRPGVRPLWTEQGGFAVGNAAGEAHPILGEGISMAMQGAWLLCARLEEHRERLLAGREQDGVARAYARDWRRSFAARIRWAALFAHLALRPTAARALRPVLRRWPSLLTVAAIVGGKVRCPAAAPCVRGPEQRREAAGRRAKVTTGYEASTRA
jgi:flavin-dependent dehydrogenase